MTSAAGSNPESSEPVLDLETQLDDLLNQIDKAESGLLDTAAPAPAPAASDSDNADDMDFEGDFEAVETLDQIISETSHDEPAITAELDDQEDNLEDNLDENLDEQYVEPEQAVQAAPVEQAAEAQDPDDAMFSPDDFITTEEASTAEHHQDSHASDSMPSHEADADADLHEDEQDEEGQDALGADLASQIQQLLDDARTDEHAPKAEPRAASKAPASPPKIEAAATAADDEPDLEGDFTSPDEEELADSEDLAGMLDAIAEAVARPEEARHDSKEKADEPAEARSQMASTPEPLDDEETASMSLEDIDQMLADEADEAVAGDFETINDVITPAAPPAEAAGKKNAGAKPADAVTAQNSEQDGQQDAADDDELDLDGSFETTQEIITQDNTEPAGAGNFSADAAAVARELDDQPERQHRNTKASKDSASSSAVAGRIGKVPSLAAFSKMPDVARSVCITISRPMEAVAPQTRDLVGYVGLITLFWGSVTVVVKLIYALNN